MKWQAPPKATTKSTEKTRKLNQNVANLQRRPGTWALVVEGGLSSGYGDAYKRRGCLVRSVKRGDQNFDIYAKWPEDEE